MHAMRPKSLAQSLNPIDGEYATHVAACTAETGFTPAEATNLLRLDLA